MSEFTNEEENPGSAVNEEEEIGADKTSTLKDDDMKMKEEVMAVFVEKDAWADNQSTTNAVDDADVRATTNSVEQVQIEEIDAPTNTASEVASETGNMRESSSFDNTFYTNCSKENYDKLREKVQHGSLTNTAYLRFLTAFDQDVDKACASMKSNIEWRERKKIDEIDLDRDCPYETAKGLLIYREDLFDRKKRPVFYNVIRRHDKNDRNIEELEKFIVANVLRGVLRAVPEEEKIVIILDLKGFTMTNMDFEGTKLLIDLLQKKFPENLGNLHILNSPFIFQACWKIIKPWIDKRTAKKVCFVNTEQLNEYVDISTLPEEVKKEYDQQFKDSLLAVKRQRGVSSG